MFLFLFLREGHNHSWDRRHKTEVKTQGVDGVACHFKEIYIIIWKLYLHSRTSIHLLVQHNLTGEKQLDYQLFLHIFCFSFETNNLHMRQDELNLPMCLLENPFAASILCDTLC